MTRLGRVINIQSLLSIVFMELGVQYLREVLVKVFGAEWYENYWPYVRYLIDSTRSAWMNRIKLWVFMFGVDDILFTGNVIEFIDNWTVFASIEGDGKVVLFDLVDGFCRVGKIDESGNINWINIYKDCGIEPIINTG